ncbi:AI-2E family transporter [Parerythrobacter jejuensis]|uniref:AI-2E family transporter n=1 Tax=Parerythrobacter jejuensis TaxID=795812 RepID=A0A845AQM5_9SPHN|nr:AI-2E family transporter [Parerythrobacter jejuensis]MXP31195.1 AI-2E family transporter [Parerythrobacter jejuensis]MXP33955.1 AI-2E family transporter [Parerythrobacter jejuensis]
MAATESKSGVEQGGFLLFLALATVAVLAISWPFIAPILWATLAAIMFQPLYQWILAKIPNKTNQAALASLLIIFFVVLVPAIWIGSIVVEQAAGIFIAFRDGQIDVAAWFDQILAALPANLRASLDSAGWTNMAFLQEQLQQLATESAGLIARQAVAIGGGALSWFLAFGIFLYVTFFLLRDGMGVGRTIVRSLPLQRDIAARLAQQFLSIVRATIKGSVVVGLVQGALGAITFSIVGMPSVVLFGVLMAIFSLLPAIGPAIVWAPAAIWLLATGAIWEGVVVLISGVAVIGMVDNALRPILVGRDTGIPDWVVLVTTLGGIASAGLSGIVIGPLVAGLFLAGWTILREQRAGDPEPTGDEAAN